MGNNGKRFWGSRELELKAYLGTNGFINAEGRIKSQRIK